MSQEHGRLVPHLASLLEHAGNPLGVRTAERLRRADVDAARRRAARAASGLAAPSVLFLSLTTRCLLACGHCSASGYAPGADLPAADAHRLLEEARALGMTVCGLTGGEPLLHPAVFELAERHPELLLLLFTSGAGLDDRAARRLAAMPHVFPVIGVEGGSSTQDRLRGPRAADRALVAMDRLRSQGVPFGFASTAREDNLPDLLSVSFYVDMFRAGARFAIVLDCLPVGRASRGSRALLPADRERLASHLRTVRRLSGGFVAYVPGDERGEGGCQAASDLVHVNPRGQIEPCPFLRVASSPGGSTLAEALSSPLFREVRRHAGTAGMTDAVPCWYLERPTLLGQIVDDCRACRTDTRPRHAVADSSAPDSTSADDDAAGTIGPGAASPLQ